MSQNKSGFKAIPGHAGVYVKLVDGTVRGERLFYISYRTPDGKQHMEKVGYKFRDKVTVFKAEEIRAAKIAGKELPISEQRRIEKEQSEAWTISRLWIAYNEWKPDRPGRAADTSRWNRYLKDIVGSKETHEIDNFTIDRIKKATRAGTKIIGGVEIEVSRSNQTVKHVLALLRILLNYGHEEKGLPSTGIAWKKKMPEVVVDRPEYRNDAETAQLFAVLREEIAEQKPVAGLMFLALLTGMRKRELLELTWGNVDLQQGVLFIKNTKEKKAKHIVLGAEARQFLETWPHTGEFVFCKPDGSRYSTIARTLTRLRDRAGLPKTFRPLHGLRHNFATLAINQGVPVSVIAKALGHGVGHSGVITARYAHVLDKALSDAAETVNSAIVGKTEK